MTLVSLSNNAQKIIQKIQGYHDEAEKQTVGRQKALDEGGIALQQICANLCLLNTEPYDWKGKDKIVITMPSQLQGYPLTEDVKGIFSKYVSADTLSDRILEIFKELFPASSFHKSQVGFNYQNTQYRYGAANSSQGHWMATIWKETSTVGAFGIDSTFTQGNVNTFISHLPALVQRVNDAWERLQTLRQKAFQPTSDATQLLARLHLQPLILDKSVSLNLEAEAREAGIGWIGKGKKEVVDRLTKDFEGIANLVVEDKELLMVPYQEEPKPEPKEPSAEPLVEDTDLYTDDL